jgi:UDP-N-acetyl-D-galactosamine dehydrogenase
MLEISEYKIGLIGLGYVGLPLALAFSKKRPVIGFDISQSRIDELKQGIDRTMEVSSDDLLLNKSLTFTSDLKDITECNFYIITVPTPISDDSLPDLGPLLNATKIIGQILKKGDFVVFESTVYPGATEEECLPILETISGLKLNKDFYLGYSPERINPGDKNHRVNNIVKVTSGSSEEAADLIDALYSEIIDAGTYQAESIMVAEAAKVIENTQRDLNIALVNEFSKIFQKLNLDTTQVLNAAKTKWNFLDFQPGLVGGHCIGVDPYYLTYKAKKMGYSPEIILAGRKLNDDMGAYVAENLLTSIRQLDVDHQKIKVLILGITFKENCPDIRNTKVIDIVKTLHSKNISVDIFDPIADFDQAKDILGIEMITQPEKNKYEGIILAVKHNIFIDQGPGFQKVFGTKPHIFYDLKSAFDITHSDLRL